MMLIRKLLGRKPKTQAELDAFNERSRIDIQWRHQKQVYKELRAHLKQEYVDRHKQRGKLRQVYFRQEAGTTTLYDNAGLAIACLPSTLTSTNPSARRFGTRTDLSLHNIESAAAQDRRSSNDPLIPDPNHIARDPSQNQVPETLPNPTPSEAEPAASQPNSESAAVTLPHAPQSRTQSLPLEVSHGNYDISQHEREAPVPVPPNLSPRDSKDTASLPYADQVSQPTTGTGTPRSRRLANFPNTALSALLLEPESSNPPDAEASQARNPPEQSITSHQEPWCDGPMTSSPLPISYLSYEGSRAFVRQNEEATVLERSSAVPNALNTTNVNAAPPHFVDTHSDMVEQAAFQVPNDQTQHRTSPYTTDIGSLVDSCVVREANAHQRQSVAIASTSQQRPPTHPPGLPIPLHSQDPGKSVGPLRNPKGKGKAKAKDEQPEAVSSIAFPVFGFSPPPQTRSEACRTVPIFDLRDPNRRTNVLYNSSIMICGNIMEMNNNMTLVCEALLVMQYDDDNVSFKIIPGGAASAT